MQSQTTKHTLQFNLNSVEYGVVTHTSNYIVGEFARYLGIAEHNLIPTISLDKQFVRVELQVPQNKVAGLERIISNITEHLNQQNVLKAVVRLFPTESHAVPAQK
ncbi:MAG: hypothetical protein AABX75_02750 [Nanoarchaeota archaeon]